MEDLDQTVVEDVHVYTIIHTLPILHLFSQLDFHFGGGMIWYVVWNKILFRFIIIITNWVLGKADNVAFTNCISEY